MAILVSQATADNNVLSLMSNDPDNTFYGSNFVDHVQILGNGNFSMLDVSSGDVIEIFGQSGSGVIAELDGNTVTFTVGGHTYTLGGIADGDSVKVRISRPFDDSDYIIERSNDRYYVGGTELVNGAPGVAASDVTAPVFQTAFTNADGTKVILGYNGLLSATTAAASDFAVLTGGVTPMPSPT